MAELRMSPDKYEMVRVVGDWIREKADVEYATFDGLDRLTIPDLKLLCLAIGCKLDLHEVARMRDYYRRQWEYRNGKKATVVIDLKAITDDT
jgi:hypothetical protein